MFVISSYLFGILMICSIIPLFITVWSISFFFSFFLISIANFVRLFKELTLGLFLNQFYFFIFVLHFIDIFAFLYYFLLPTDFGFYILSSSFITFFISIIIFSVPEFPFKSFFKSPVLTSNCPFRHL